MIYGILKEPEAEHRVSMVPEIAGTLFKGFTGWYESDCGKNASYTNNLYNAQSLECRSREEILGNCDIVFSIHALNNSDISRMKKGAWLFGLYQPLSNREKIELIAEKGITLFSLDSIPRISRAQSMDVLSSMATASGYQAVLEAARLLPRFFPMFMTAAGTIPPAKVLILGAGVAGLQAIATAKRLGAVVEAFDTRLSVKEQVESWGGKFVMVEGAVEDKSAGGYAVEQSEDYQRKQKEAIAAAVAKSDVVICTAQIPGKRAPVLVTTHMVEKMKPGSVIIDLAASTGGNCEKSVNNELVVYNQITILGNSNLQSSKAEDASRMFSKNIQQLFKLLLKEGKVFLNTQDEIIHGTCITHDGQIRTR